LVANRVLASFSMPLETIHCSVLIKYLLANNLVDAIEPNSFLWGELRLGLAT
jgi:hypothetical protein